MTYTLFTDGGARGNPGPAGIGAILVDDKNNVVFELSKYIGETTNNVAEYKALIEGLLKTKEKEIKNIDCILDSELVVKQLNGLYKVKNESMHIYFTQVKKLEKFFDKVTYRHVKRELNSRADSLVNEALDSLNA